MTRPCRSSQLATLSALSLALVVSCTPSGAPNTANPPTPTKLALVAGVPWGFGNINGPIGQSTGDAMFGNPASVAMDSTGNIYVADTRNGAIRKISTLGVVTDVAADGVFWLPMGVALDASNNIYVADARNDDVYLIPHDTTIPSGGTPALLAPNAAVPFSEPVSVAVDKNQTVYVTDDNDDQVYFLPLADRGNALAWETLSPMPADGYSYPTGVAVDSNLNVFVADGGAATVWEIASGAASVVALPAPSGGFSNPVGVAVDSSNNVYVADAGLQGILRSTPGAPYATALIAGGSATTGASDGTGTVAEFGFDCSASVGGLVADPNPANQRVYVADTLNNIIRKVALNGSGPASVQTLAGRPAGRGYANGPGADAAFTFTASLGFDNRAIVANVAVDGAGNIYLGDTYNGMVRKITPLGVVSTLAGPATPGASDRDGQGSAASFDQPGAVALDGSGTVYVAELGGAIRAVTSGGEASTLAVAGTFNAPIGLALDGAGYLYVAAQGLGSANAPGVFRFNIASAAAAAPGSGLVLELVGSSWGAGPTPLSYPDGLAIDGQGNVYVADGGQSIIVKYTPGATAGTWTGARMAGQAGASGYRDGNAASQALFDAPGGLALDAVSGYLFVADAGNNLIRAISPGAGAMVTTVAGTPLLSGTVPGMLPATFFYPMGLALNPSSRELVITVPDAVLELQ